MTRTSPLKEKIKMSDETVGIIFVLVFGLLWGFVFTFTGCMYLELLA